MQRAQDLLARAEKGEITYTPFLTPGEQARLNRHLTKAMEGAVLWGGYAQAERQRIFFLPPYLTELEPELRATCLAEFYAESVVALEIQGSGYRELSHRDFLGALLHLGVERDRLGDVCVTAPDHAIFFCDRILADFFLEHLERVANDAVRLRYITLPTDFDGGRRFVPVSDTVASPRADAVVAALANLPRERAQSLFTEGKVEIDYELEERTDRTVLAGAVIVIRGYGKFIIRSLSDKTRKGRYRLLADQYV
ncbi:MAG: hypothetical protein E7585_04010 [Ruminococcaceae bacterium]|nr:hypothetical protein [Oscillospiraceae bacterium]